MFDSIEKTGHQAVKLVSAKLPQDDAGAKLMRFENVRGQRYTEIFLIGATRSSTT